MKKFLTITFLMATLLIGSACAEEPDPEGATAAPKEINHADSIYYTHIDFYNMTSTDDRIILPNYPTYQQTTGYSCGSAAALTVLKFFGVNDYDEATLIKRMKTKPHTGTTLGNMIKFFNSIGWKIQSNRELMDEFDFQKFVIKNLRLGKPILIENVEWGGHWRVIIGCDTMGTKNLYDDVLIFADPFDTSDHNQDGYTIGSLDRFYSMWFDNNERNQAWLIATPK